MYFTVLFGEFLQIIITGHRHWITISTIGMSQTGSANINVFDSMKDWLKPKLLALCIHHTQSNMISVQIVDIKKQVYNLM